MLRLTAGLDQGSENPLANAVVKAARERGFVLVQTEGFDSSTGIGAQGSVGGKKRVLGNALCGSASTKGAVKSTRLTSSR